MISPISNYGYENYGSYSMNASQVKATDAAKYKGRMIDVAC